MDNVQRQYLILFAASQEKALACDIQGCLDICFDLRLQPDLAYHTRGLVCLTIANLSNYEEMPEKMTFAKEALRIARELKEHSKTQDVYWTEAHNQLEIDAARAVERIEIEEQQYLDNLYESVAIKNELRTNEAARHGNASIKDFFKPKNTEEALKPNENAPAGIITVDVDEMREEEDKSDVEQNVIKKDSVVYCMTDSEDDEEIVGMPRIEGLLSLRTPVREDVDDLYNIEDCIGSSRSLALHSNLSIPDLFAASKASKQNHQEASVDEHKK